MAASSSRPERDRPLVGRLGRQHPRAARALPQAPSPTITAYDSVDATHRIIIGVADPTVRATIAFYLCLAGYHVVVSADEHELLLEAATWRPSLIILDPEQVGAPRGREVFGDLPVVIVRRPDGRRTWSSVAAHDAHDADDEIVTPIEPEAMLLQVAALIRRYESGHASSPTQVLGPLRLDRLRHEVTVDGIPIALTPAEFRILSILAARPGLVHSRQDLMAQLGAADVQTSRGIDMHVLRLRGKLGTAKHMVETIRGFGYRLLEPPAPLWSAPLTGS